MLVSPLEIDDLVLHIFNFIPYDHVRSCTCFVNQQFYRVSTHSSLLRAHVLHHLFPCAVAHKGQEKDITACDLHQFYHMEEFWDLSYHMLRLPESKFDSSISSEQYSSETVLFEMNDHMFSVVKGGNITGFGKFRFKYHDIQEQKTNKIIPFYYFEISIDQKVLGYNLSVGVSNSQFEATENYTGYGSDHADIHSHSVGYSSDGYIRCDAQSLQDGVSRDSYRESGYTVGVLVNFLPGDESVTFFLNGQFQYTHVIDNIREFFEVDQQNSLKWIGGEPYVTATCTVNSHEDKVKFLTQGFSVPFDTYIAPLVIKYMQGKEGTDEMFER